jgi:hypothetical protein
VQITEEWNWQSEHLKTFVMIVRIVFCSLDLNIVYLCKKEHHLKAIPISCIDKSCFSGFVLPIKQLLNVL